MPAGFPNLPVKALSAPMLIKPEALALADVSTWHSVPAAKEVGVRVWGLGDKI